MVVVVLGVERSMGVGPLPPTFAFEQHLPRETLSVQATIWVCAYIHIQIHIDVYIYIYIYIYICLRLYIYIYVYIYTYICMYVSKYGRSRRAPQVIVEVLGGDRPMGVAPLPPAFAFEQHLHTGVPRS